MQPLTEGGGVAWRQSETHCKEYVEHVAATALSAGNAETSACSFDQSAYVSLHHYLCSLYAETSACSFDQSAYVSLHHNLCSLYASHGGATGVFGTHHKRCC